MSDAIINEAFQGHKIRLMTLLDEMNAYVRELGAQNLSQTLDALGKNLNAPFLFVVVGEVKAGKSRFINALLGERICAVDAAPCTDVVQQILYDENYTEERITPYLKRIGLPNDILKTIAVVDTPGTNTIIENHQDITKEFIPNSDLVIFVFPAKNPYHQSAWDLLEFVSEEWRKRVVFILQQADLATPEELATNIENVREFAIKRDISNPKIFVTSAVWEDQHNPQSGFEEIRSFIRETITGGRHYYLKLQSVIASAKSILDGTDKLIKALEKQLTLDRKALENIKIHLDSGLKQSEREMMTLIERMLLTYDRVTQDIRDDFYEGLSLTKILGKSFGSVFRGKHKTVDLWLASLQTRLEAQLMTRFEETVNDGAKHFIEGVSVVLNHILVELKPLEFPLSSSDALSRKLIDERMEVIQEVRNKLTEFLGSEAFAEALSDMPDKLAPSMLGGGALALTGTVLMMVTQLSILDISGGLIAGIGVLLSGGMLYRSKSKLKRRFQRAVDEGKNKIKLELSDRLMGKVKMVYEHIDRNFLPFYQYVKAEDHKTQQLCEKGATLRAGLKQHSEAIHKSLTESF